MLKSKNIYICYTLAIIFLIFFIPNVGAKSEANAVIILTQEDFDKAERGIYDKGIECLHCPSGYIMFEFKDGEYILDEDIVLNYEKPAFISVTDCNVTLDLNNKTIYGEKSDEFHFSLINLYGKSNLTLMGKGIIEYEVDDYLELIRNMNGIHEYGAISGNVESVKIEDVTINGDILLSPESENSKVEIYDSNITGSIECYDLDLSNTLNLILDNTNIKSIDNEAVYIKNNLYINNCNNIDGDILVYGNDTSYSDILISYSNIKGEFHAYNSNLEIDNVKINCDNNTAAYISSVGNLIIKDSEFVGNNDGLYVKDTDSVFIDNGTFVGNEDAGIVLYCLPDIVKISSGTFIGNYGIMIFKENSIETDDLNTILAEGSNYEIEPQIKYKTSYTLINEITIHKIATQSELSIIKGGERKSIIYDKDSLKDETSINQNDNNFDDNNSENGEFYLYNEYQGYTFKHYSNSGDTCCYDSSGNPVINEFKCDGTYTYYFQADGTAMKDRLTYHPDGVHVIYFDHEGHEVFSDFANVKKTIAGDAVNDYCFFDVYGYMYVDVLTYDKTGTVLYYANPYGVMEMGKWFQFSDTVKWADDTPAEGIAGGYGYANEDGTLMTNTQTIDWAGRSCYLQGNGVASY